MDFPMDDVRIYGIPELERLVGQAGLKGDEGYFKVSPGLVRHYQNVAGNAKAAELLQSPDYTQEWFKGYYYTVMQAWVGEKLCVLAYRIDFNTYLVFIGTGRSFEGVDLFEYFEGHENGWISGFALQAEVMNKRLSNMTKALL